MEPENASGKKRPRRISRPTLFAVAMISIAMLISPTCTCANDSTAALAAGGIELTKNDNIRMLEEVLEISTRKVKVRYRFLNETCQDIETKVAFPLPLYDGVAHANISLGDPSRIFSTFKVSVDNKPVAPQCERKALLEGRDVTDRLRRLGLSDKEIFFDVADRDKADLWDRLKPAVPKIGNWWDISQVYFWDMTFPAGQETLVDHEYEPASGGGWTTPYYRDSAKHFPANMTRLWSSFTGKFSSENEDCLDETTKRAIENRVNMAVANGSESVTVSYSNVKYILGTGRNWKGPIGEFKLRLIKDKPTHFVSVCFPGKPEKISPTVYEFTQKDFVPQDTLAVYFYRVEPN